MRHDIEQDGALQGVNFNTRILEGLGAQIASNFEQVKQVINASLDMAVTLEQLKQIAQAAERERGEYLQIIAAVTKQVTKVLDSASPDRASGGRARDIDGKEAAIAANMINVLGKDTSD